MRARGLAVGLAAAAFAFAVPAAVSADAAPVPPPAPSPTDSGNSPAAPDPHPPRGGLAPDGHAVGGTRLLSRGVVTALGAPALPKDVTAQAWLVADLDSGRIVGARDAHGRYQPASIQKLLTSVALLPRLPGGRTVTVSRGAATTEGSHAGLVPGGTYTVDDLFRGLLLVSGNDCAEALAEAAGGRAATVALMNRTARALGADDTLVQTPSGLDGWQQLTSAYDMALVLRAALAQPRFAAYDRVHHAYLPAQRGAVKLDRVPLWNQNVDFLDGVDGALVAKTGFTDAAQHTFVGAIERGGHRYGVVLLRAQRWPVDQWVQATRLVRWAAGQPLTTSVGTLERPLAARPTASPTRGVAASPVSATATGGGDDVWPWVLVVLAVGLLGGGSVLVRRSLR